MLRVLVEKLRNIDSNLEKLKVDSEELLDPLKIFKSHSNKLFNLLSMPEDLVNWGLAVAGWRSARHDAQLSLYTKKMNAGQKFSEIRITKAELEVEANEIIHKYVPDDDSIDIEFNKLIHAADDWKDAVKFLKQSTTTQAWIGFESAAKNIWVSALNARPLTLGQPTFNLLPDDSKESEVSSKTIQVGLAAKFGFDLRTHLGTILSERYDFTSVGGIKKAYKTAFQSIDTLNKNLDNPVLFKLEQTRNLLVHRAGIIDDAYKNKTRCPQSCGEELAVSDAEFEEFIISSLDATIELFKFTDDYLIKTKTVAYSAERER